MYAYINGRVAALGRESVILDNSGIGYRIFVPSSVPGQLHEGEDAKLYTFFSVREDAMQLYGFLSREELELFKMLLSVSGIGPKGALGILSVISADDLRFAVLSGDAAVIAKAPGIGKKTAQKVILELKDKLDLEEAFEEKASHAAGGRDADQVAGSEAVMALAALGYSESEAFRAVREAEKTSPGADTEELIRTALRNL